METPQYTINPSAKAISLAQFFQVLLLCLFFYAGIFVNLSILNVKVPFWANILIALFLFFLLLAQTMITVSRAKKYHYDFYEGRIEFYGKKLESVLYQEIETVKVSRNIFDLLSGTGTIILSRKFRIRYVGNYREIQEYINNIVQTFTISRSQQLIAPAAATQ